MARSPRFPVSSIRASSSSAIPRRACAAARVEDRLGNFNIARPLRVCFDQDLDGAENCPALGAIETGPLPDCTGIYDPMTDTVDAAANCTVSSDPLDNFPAQQIRFK